MDLAAPNYLMVIVEVTDDGGEYFWLAQRLFWQVIQVRNGEIHVLSQVGVRHGVACA